MIERYKQVILHGKPDLMKSAPGAECNSIQDQLLDLNVGPSKITKGNLHFKIHTNTISTVFSIS